MKRKNNILWLMCFVLLMPGCSYLTQPPAEDQEYQDAIAGSTTDIVNSIPYSEKLVEDRKVYEQDDDSSVVHMYLTVMEQEEGQTFYDLNHFYDMQEDLTLSPHPLKAIIQEGDENGPSPEMFQGDQELANSTVELRGNTTRLARQKSFQIKLEEQAGLWKGQTILNLNKHPFDYTRVRNKLSFDYFEEIPNFTSMRTQFVKLHVKDLSEGENSGFVDYGLYTHIEQPNKRFLFSHGLDPNGNLYKANFFEFFRYPDQIKLADDPEYDKAKFEEVLQIRTGEDHTNLIEMLDSVNDYSQNINDVIDTHYDRDNYLTWMAINILMGNTDTTTQNFFLYNPINSKKFYFLPWDYDDAWKLEANNEGTDIGDVTKWNRGISNFWGSVLHQRFLKDPDNVEAVEDKLSEVLNIITPERTQELIDQYYPIVNEAVRQNPDLSGLPIRVETFDDLYQDLVYAPDEKSSLFYENLGNPMPVYMADPEKIENHMLFSWGASYDLQGDDLTYSIEISKTIDFAETYYSKKNLEDTQIEIPLKDLRKGENFWRIIITDEEGNTQEAFDRIYLNDIFYNGLKEFFVD
ncbi:CotH kinase family protein [Jeotgalibacillus salarius]|nr:CotH kinase family protein [Jeotgalibacillus salarius]